MNEAVRVLIERTYNRILKERDIAEYKYRRASESAEYKDEYDRCKEDLKELEESVAAEGYEFEEDDWKTVRLQQGDGVVLLRYRTYKLVPVAQ